MTPRDRGVKRPLALGKIGSTASQNGQMALQPRTHRLKGQHTRARRRQLDREGEPVQARADGAEDVELLGAEYEPRLMRPPAVDKELDRGGSAVPAVDVK